MDTVSFDRKMQQQQNMYGGYLWLITSFAD